MKFVRENRRYTKRTIIKSLFIYALTVPFFAMTQQLEEKEGELEDTQVIIEKNLEITLPEAKRSYGRIKVPVRKEQQKSYQYDIKTFVYQPVLEKLAIEVTPYRADSINLPHQNYLRAGYGNYNAPYVETMISNAGGNKLQRISAFYKHDSYATGPVEKEKSAQGVNEIKLKADITSTLGTLGAQASWERNVNHFYGNNGTELGSADSIKNVYSFYHLETRLSDDLQSKTIRLGFNFYDDNQELSEFEMYLNGDVKAKLNDELSLITSGEISLGNYSGIIEQINRDYFLVSPRLVHQSSKLQLHGGFNFTYQNDSLLAEKANFHPLLELNYHFTSSLGLEMGLDGNVDKKTYHSFKRQNPFLTDASPTHIKRQSYFFNVYASPNSVNLKAGIRYSDFEFLPIFVNMMTDESLFMMENIQSVKELNVLLSADKRFNNKLTAGVTINYFDYNATDDSTIYHRPTVQSDFSVQYQPIDGLNISSSLGIQSGRKARNRDGSTRILKTISDLSLSANYQLDKKVSVFITMNNLLSSKSEYYNLYTGRRVSGRVGFSYLF